jgi:hypothetical protein
MNYSGYPSFVNHCDETETTNTAGGFSKPLSEQQKSPLAGAGVIDSFLFNIFISADYTVVLRS